MEDELEDLIFIQFYHAAMKVVSRFSLTNPFGGASSLSSSGSAAGGVPTYCGHLLRMAKLYMAKPEICIATFVFVIFLAYIQFAEKWGRSLLPNFRIGLPRASLNAGLLASPAEKESLEIRKSHAVAYSIQGRRAKQEDRFIVEQNINNDTGIAFFAIFDGHGGEFAAEFAKDILVQNLYNKMMESSNILKGKKSPTKAGDAEEKCDTTDDKVPDEATPPVKLDDGAVQRRKSFKKSMTEDLIDDARAAAQPSSTDLLMKLNALSKPITKEDFLQPKVAKVAQKPRQYEAKCYIESNRSINFGKMMTDEVLAADYKLVEQAKKNTSIAGTTALMMVIHQQKLVVANVGDSRGVMCDGKGNAIPLSFDHKPQQVREHKRIHDAGGFIAFRGVWRVAGILATSRALGDYPLKDRNLVIADPDILTFDLTDHKPQFIILASDGLWDTFTNEEAVAFIRERVTEPHFGAKSIVLQSYTRGSVDNITVIVVVFKDGRYEIGTSQE